MFETLTGRLGDVLRQMRGQARLTDDNIKETLGEIRTALLEADVALPVAKAFIERVSTQALGQEVLKSLTPGQVLIKIVHDELVLLMGEACSELNLKVRPPAVVLVAGLQGAGKTTSIAKLALWLKDRNKKSVMVTSCDVYRPAAIDQLQTLAQQVGVSFVASSAQQLPRDIAQQALVQARQQGVDVLIVDTAGRLHIDQAMMAEIQDLHRVLNPVETLFVVDSMTGQDAANTAKAFHEALPLTGVILTKTDGDARGGAALSIRHITGKPIKFLGVGEKIEALEPFHPDRVASRILGMGDVLSLVEEVQYKTDQEKAVKLLNKIKRGKDFDLGDFRDQLQEMLAMGDMSSLIDKLPGMAQVPKAVKDQVNNREINRMVAIVNSMTPQERQFPAIIKGSRKKRIASGSGTQVQEVNKLLKQFAQIQKMMSKKGNFMKMMQQFKGRMPGMPF